MITPDLNVFPFNVTTVINGALSGIDADSKMFDRPLRATDPNQSISVFAHTWGPKQDSMEIGSREPTVQQYTIGVQGMVKHGDKDMALAISTMLSKRIRDTLYRSDTLRLALGNLSVADGFHQERFQRMVLRNQQFMSKEIKTTFSMLSVLDILIETETV